MKGICHLWSRGRHFSPSLPGDRYLKLDSKSDLRAEISGSIVWYDALAPRPEVLLLSYFVGACAATLELIILNSVPLVLHHPCEKARSYVLGGGGGVIISGIRFVRKD